MLDWDVYMTVSQLPLQSVFVAIPFLNILNIDKY